MTRHIPLIVGGLLTIAAVGAAPDKDGKAITGCLTKTGSGQYVLTQEGTGKMIPVRGSADLEKHSANHKVKLTGEMVQSGGHDVMQVSALQHISDSCTATKK
jgi:hypothetical protein